MKSTRKSAEDTEDGSVDNMALKGRVCRLVISVGGGPVPCEVWHLLKPHPDELLMWPEVSARDQARGSIWQVLDEQWLTGHNVEVKENGESEEKLRSSTTEACKCRRHQKTVCWSCAVPCFWKLPAQSNQTFPITKAAAETLLSYLDFCRHSAHHHHLSCKSRSRRARLRHIASEVPGSPASLKRSVRVFVNVQMSRRIFLKCKQRANVGWREMFGQMSP